MIIVIGSTWLANIKHACRGFFWVFLCVFFYNIDSDVFSLHIFEHVIQYVRLSFINHTAVNLVSIVKI